MYAVKTQADQNRPPTVIVAGAQGVSGNAVLQQYAELTGAKVYTLSRRSGEDSGNVHHIAVDLLNLDDTVAKLGDVRDATHLFFGAYVERRTAAEKSTANVLLLRNLLDVVEKNSPELRHITIYQGGKAYGSDLGPYKTPAREDDLRLMSPNFYYDQEDLLRQRQKGHIWNFTIFRPGGAICGVSIGTPMSLISVIVVYAAICREMGLPLRFPGAESAYRSLYQATSADLLARAVIWAGETVSARNELFNVTNGDNFRWQHMWSFSKLFGAFLSTLFGV
jgi:nucleoside-diphosphate-sugar epimerase